MSRDPLRRLMQPIRVIYLSNAPLFAANEASQPLVPGTYVAVQDALKLSFTLRGRVYTLSGAWPETVMLIPAPGHIGIHVFQQSDGPGSTFYGALRLLPVQPGFQLFSPEGDRDAAIAAAVANSATANSFGYQFADRAALLAALMQITLGAPAGAWEMYRPD